MRKSRVPNLKVEDYQTELALRALKAEIDDKTTDQDVEITDPMKGLILRDTAGIRYRVTVSLVGALVVTRV